MRLIEQLASTPEEAITLGLARLGVDRDQVEIEVVREAEEVKGPGELVVHRPAVVKLLYLAPQPEPPAPVERAPEATPVEAQPPVEPESAPSEVEAQKEQGDADRKDRRRERRRRSRRSTREEGQSTSRREEEEEELTEEQLERARALTEELLREIIERMGLEATLSARAEGRTVFVDLKSPDSSLLIGRRGATCDALSYLLRKALSKELERSGPSVRLNFEKKAPEAGEEGSSEPVETEENGAGDA